MRYEKVARTCYTCGWKQSGGSRVQRAPSFFKSTAARLKHQQFFRRIKNNISTIENYHELVGTKSSHIRRKLYRMILRLKENCKLYSEWMRTNQRTRMPATNQETRWLVTHTHTHTHTHYKCTILSLTILLSTHQSWKQQPNEQEQIPEDFLE